MKNVTLIALALSFALAACSDSNTGTVSFALTAAAPGVTATGDSTVIMLGNDSIIIRSAQLVLRKVELKRSDVASCDAVAGNDDCEEFETGATLVTLPLGSATITQQCRLPRLWVRSTRSSSRSISQAPARTRRSSRPIPTL